MVKEFCMLPNLCGDPHCCNHCLVERCDTRCLDDCSKCRYNCKESEVPTFTVVKIKKEPVITRRRK